MLDKSEENSSEEDPPAFVCQMERILDAYQREYNPRAPRSLR